MAWLSVRRDGAEVWNGFGFDVEHGNAAARERRECVRDGVGRAMRLRMESMIVCVRCTVTVDDHGETTLRSLPDYSRDASLRSSLYSIFFFKIYHYATQQQKTYRG